MEKEFIAQEITNWLNQESIRNKLNTSKNILNITFHHLVRWYPQISSDGRDTYGLSILNQLENWRLSERAELAIRAKMNELPVNIKKGLMNEEFKKLIHPEHNVPVKVKKMELLASEAPTVNRVHHVLETGYEVILISKEEAAVLNGSMKTLFSLDVAQRNGCGMSSTGKFTERLDAIDARIISAQNQQNLIQDIQNRFHNT